jgi:divalent metal cation (Fe/Co/Zn/Cd) transporter
MMSRPLQRALWLVGGTMAYNALEAIVAVWAGHGAHSIALVGFGLDSVIECAAAAILLWRLAMERRGALPAAVAGSERMAHRFVGGTFLALAVYVLAQAGWTIWRRDAPRQSLPGIALAIASLIVMPLISWGKLRAADKLRSPALRAEAKETLACSYLSLTLLVGLLANAVAGWWWADPAAAGLMIPWLTKEGMEGLREGGRRPA